MTRGRGIAAALTIAIATGLLSAPTPAGAEHGEHLDLEAQTTFVGVEPAVIEVRVTDPEPDDRLVVEIFAARTSREALRATFDQPPDEVPISFFDTPLAQPLGEEQTVVIEIPDDLVGELLRRDQGALPVGIALTAPDGTVRDTLVTHLLVVDGPRSPLSLAFLADLSAPLGLQPDQTVSIDGADLVARADAIARYAVPVSVALQPESLRALDAAGDTASLADLTAALVDPALLRSPWVSLDEEGWRRAGERDRVTEQYARGVATIEQYLATSPSTIAELDPDATAETLGLLRTVGATGVVAEAGLLDQLTLDRAAGLPVQVLDANGLPMTVLAIDEALHETLLDPDPELAGHQALAELAVAADPELELALTVRLDGVDPAAIDIVRRGLDQRSFLQAVPLGRLFEIEPARTVAGDLRRGRLRSAPAPDLTDRATELRRAGALVDAYAEMVRPADAPIVALEALLLGAASADLDDAGARAYAAAAIEAVDTGTGGITIVSTDRITLTDRRADLPLTMRNLQPLPITVDLFLSAEKLRFPDGDLRTVVLQPGDNVVPVRVRTLASGDARVTATLTSPGGAFEITSETIDIRSTAISGLGLVISIAALVVLGAWWIRTILRVRRTRAAATVAPVPGPRDEPTQGEM